MSESMSKASTAITDIRHYQEQASSAMVAPGSAPSLPWTGEAALLALEGWEYITRNGVRIWRDTSEEPMGHGSWTSEEAAHGWLSDLDHRDQDREERKADD